MNLQAIPWWCWLIPVVLLLVATARMPYGYYTFTRVVVCGFATFLAVTGSDGGTTTRAWSVLFALLAVLFSPIVPIYLHRGTWFYLDIGAAAIFVAHLLFVRVGLLQLKRS
jgi:hypothetical protein